MSKLWPLLARNRYSAEEWKLASRGQCDWAVEFGNGRGVRYCGRPSSPQSFYRWCAGHDREARSNNPGAYGR